jgi:hypothetical protein
VDVVLRNGGADRVEMGLARTTPLVKEWSIATQMR